MWQSRSIIWRWLSVVVLSMVAIYSSAQRVVTPVESNDLPIEIQKKEYAKVATDTTTVDSVEHEEPMYDAPTFGGLLLTADLSAPVMNLLGTQYGSYEVALEANFLHRFFPVVEAGMGMANYKPEDNNYTFKVPLSPYARVGVNYNFFYKNGSPSFISAGVRYGVAVFSYYWDNIALNDAYWDTTVDTSTPSQSAFAHWGEIVVNLRVQIVKNFYMGWSGRYRILLGCTTSPYGDPYYIPGFGVKDSGFGFTYTVGYNLPIGEKKKKVNEEILTP